MHTSRTILLALLAASLSENLHLLAQSAIPDSLTLIAHYPLDGNANDSTGAYNPMVLENTPFQDGGIYSNGIYADGVAENAVTAYTPNLDELNVDAFGAEFEFRVSAPLLESGSPVVFAGRFWRWMGLWVNPDSTVSPFHTGARWHAYKQPFIVDSLHTGAFTYSAADSTGRFFLDGAEFEALKFKAEHNDDRAFTLEHGGVSAVFQGLLADLKVYSHVPQATNAESGPIADLGLEVEHYPNPTAGATQVSYNLDRTDRVTFSLYDAMGRRLFRRPQGLKSPGQHSLDFDASLLAAGPYIYRLKTSRGFASGRVVVR